jgi:hypothetical protein
LSYFSSSYFSFFVCILFFSHISPSFNYYFSTFSIPFPALFFVFLYSIFFITPLLSVSLYSYFLSSCFPRILCLSLSVMLSSFSFLQPPSTSSHSISFLSNFLLFFVFFSVSFCSSLVIHRLLVKAIMC